jgi:Flp pilus assembly protein TadG
MTAGHGSSIARNQRGSGVLSAMIGLTVMLVLVAVTTQVALGLLARTTAEAVAYDAARRVATAPSDMSRSQAEEMARQHARDVLGERAEEVELSFLPTQPDRVVLRVRAEGRPLISAELAGAVRFGALDRRIVLVREAP